MIFFLIRSLANFIPSNILATDLAADLDTGSSVCESHSVVSDSAIPWTILSMEFSRPEYWSGYPIPFSKGSSQPRDQAQVSCITGGFFIS